MNPDAWCSGLTPDGARCPFTPMQHVARIRAAHRTFSVGRTHLPEEAWVPLRT